jgi:hypothetical protein
MSILGTCREFRKISDLNKVLTFAYHRQSAKILGFIEIL